MTFCWKHDWVAFREPTQSTLIKRDGTTRYWFNKIDLGLHSNIAKVSDLVCYKCKGKKLNLSKILDRRLKKEKKKAAEKQKVLDIKQAKQDAIQEAIIQLRAKKKTNEQN